MGCVLRAGHHFARGDCVRGDALHSALHLFPGGGCELDRTRQSVPPVHRVGRNVDKAHKIRNIHELSEKRLRERRKEREREKKKNENLFFTHGG
jgi:hypothetical protein